MGSKGKDPTVGAASFDVGWGSVAAKVGVLGRLKLFESHGLSKDVEKRYSLIIVIK